MKSKTPPPDKPARDEWSEESDAECFPSSARPEASRLVSRIAKALNVTPADLYATRHQSLPPSPPDAGKLATEHDLAHDFASECAALLHAYIAIREPDVRRRLLMLVQEAAGRP